MVFSYIAKIYILFRLIMMQISEKSVNTFFYCATIRATIGKRNEKVIFNQRITSLLFHYFVFYLCSKSEMVHGLESW